MIIETSKQFALVSLTGIIESQLPTSNHSINAIPAIVANCLPLAVIVAAQEHPLVWGTFVVEVEVSFGTVDICKISKSMKHYTYPSYIAPAL